MSTKPRTPRYFPRMKVRGAKRKQQAPFQRVLGAFDRFELIAAQMAQQITEDFKNFRPRHITPPEPGEGRTP